MAEKAGFIDPGRLREVLGCYPTGVTVVTALDDDGEPVGMVIGSFGSVSLDPPLVMFMPAKSSTTWPRMEHAGSFCVNVMGEDHLELSNEFFAKDGDPWSLVGWTAGASGAPVLDDSLAWIDCVTHDVVEAGDHWIVLGRVVGLEGSTEGRPLIFFRGGYGRFEG